jgi:hypothetical protein
VNEEESYSVLSTEKKAPGTFFDVSNPHMVRCGRLLFFWKSSVDAAGQ